MNKKTHFYSNRKTFKQIFYSRKNIIVGKKTIS